MQIEESPFKANKEGSAVFLPLEESLSAARRAAKRALLAGVEPVRFHVTQEIDYYPGMIDALLAEGRRFFEHVEPYCADMRGEEKGALRCIAMWDMRHWEGLLLHEDNDGLCGAYLPACTEATARAERDFAENLAELARRAEPLRLRMEIPARSTPWRIEDILTFLSRRI